jgi:hypothetical protein
MGRKIRLTESEFHTLIRRIVKETQEEMMNQEMEEGFFGDMADKVRGFGDKFAKAVEMAKEEAMEFFEELSPAKLSTVKMKIRDLNLEPVVERIGQMEDEESELNESYFLNEGIMDRVERFMARYGLGLSGTLGISGFLAFLSEIPGWIDFDFLTKVHEIVEMTGLGNYAGPVSFLVFALGVIGAIWSLASKDSQSRR